MRKYILSILLSIIGFIASAETATLSPYKNDYIVNKGGTVTFSSYGVTLEEIAKRYQLTHISGTKYKAAIIYSFAFDSGKGKIFNCTDNTIYVKCEYYSGNSLIKTSNEEVAPRTFGRIHIPKNCDRIICKD